MILEAFGHSIHRFRGLEVSEDSNGVLRTVLEPHKTSTEISKVSLIFVWDFEADDPLGAGGCFVGNAAEVRSPRLTLIHRNRCIECPNASKTIGNQLPMKKYIGAVLRKSSQLELVAEIGPLENALPAQKNQRNYIEKSSLKKIKLYSNTDRMSCMHRDLTHFWRSPRLNRRFLIDD